jgi:hypothetical protein
MLLQQGTAQDRAAGADRDWEHGQEQERALDWVRGSGRAVDSDQGWERAVDSVWGWVQAAGPAPELKTLELSYQDWGGGGPPPHS